MISSTAVLALDMYFDMPSVGVPGLIWKGLLAEAVTDCGCHVFHVGRIGRSAEDPAVCEICAFGRDVCPVWYNVVYRLLWRRGGCLFGNGDERYGAEPCDV